MYLELALVAALAGYGVLASPVYDSIERKIKARLHSRIGPPILQSWYDILKLLKKELVIPEGGYFAALVVLIELVLALGLVITTTALLFFNSILTYVVVAVFVSAFSGAILLKSVMQNNIFSIIGGAREYSMIISSEPFFIILLIILSAGNAVTLKDVLAAVPILMTSYMMTGRIPFDIAEAKPEIASGIMIELSGPLLAANECSLFLRRYAMASLPAFIFLAKLPMDPLLKVGVALGATFITWVAYAVTAVLLGRARSTLIMKGSFVTALALTVAYIVVWGVYH